MTGRVEFSLGQNHRFTGWQEVQIVGRSFLNVKSASINSGGRKSRKGKLSVVYAPYHSGTGERKRRPRGRAEVYLLEKPVDLYSFDEDYLRRLGARDPEIVAHFYSYLHERLKITLRARGIDAHTLEDVRQETFCRVWKALQKGEVQNPKGFGSYVHSVCKNVLSESRRTGVRNQHDPLESTDLPDGKLGLEDMIQREENGEIVREVLNLLPERDRHILQARFFDERENEDVCAQFGVERAYLRVLLHRAINRFGELYKELSKKKTN